MRSIRVDAFGGPETLRVVWQPRPQPGIEQIRIAVEAAGVNPVDLISRDGTLNQIGLLDGPPIGLGWDVAGTVDAVGHGVRRFAIGQRVAGLSDRLAAPSKAYAEYMVLDQAAVAPIPDSLDTASAATLPLAGLTALQSLEHAGVSSGAAILVTGASGAVGSLVVQLAVLRGVRVIAAVRNGDEDVAGTVATIATGAELAETVRTRIPGGVDAAIDAAGVGSPALDAVRSGGVHVSLQVLDRPTPLRGIASKSVAVRADAGQLSTILALAGSGLITARPVDVLPLEDVSVAHERVASGRRRRSLVLQPHQSGPTPR